MERLTEKTENGFYRLKKGQEIYGEENGIRLVQIVGSYEDVKERLGVSLTAIFNADKIWFKLYGRIHCATQKATPLKPMFFFNREEIMILDDHGCRTIAVYTWNGYGSKWAFTKEELE